LPRRLALLLATVAVLVVPRAALATLIQQNVAGGTTPVAPTWSTKATTAGNLLVAIVQSTNTATIGPPSGWVLATSVNQSTNVGVAIYYYPNAPAKTQGTAESFTAAGSASTVVQIAEFSGILTASPLDGTGTAVAPTATSITVSATSATGPVLAIAGFGNDGNVFNKTYFQNPSTFATFGGGDYFNNNSDELSAYDLSVPAGSVSETAIAKMAKTPSNMAAVMATFKINVPTVYWRGGLTGCNGYWDSTSCWASTSGGASTGAIPTSANAVVFDGGGTGNCTISSASTGNAVANSITVQSAYTGTITQTTQPVVLYGAFILNGGTFTGNSTKAFLTNGSGSYDGDLIITGGTFQGGGAAIGVRALTVSGGSFLPGTSSVTMTDPTTISGGTVTFGSGALTIGAGLSVSGGTVTLGNPTTAPSFTGALAVSGGQLSFTNNSTNPDLSIPGAFTQSNGNVDLNGAQLTTGTNIAPGSDGFMMNGGTFNTNNSTAVVNVTGNTKNSGATTTLSGTATFNGSSGTETFAGPLSLSGSALMYLGTASMTSGRTGGTSANDDAAVSIGSGATLTLGSAGFNFFCNNAMTLAGTLNAGSGNVSFAPAVNLTGAFNAQSSPSVTFSGVVTMTGTSTFNGGTATGTFSKAPVFTAGIFTVGTAGTTGRWTFTLGASFAAGMAVVFPSSGGELATASAQTISIAGTLSTATTGATLPKIDCPACTTNQGFTMQLSGVLNVSGLQFDHVAQAGVQILTSASFTLFKGVKFTNNAAGGTTAGVHLSITRANDLIVAPGCYFDATAATNVALVGTSASPGVRAIFEYQSAAVNGARAGESFDSDADTNEDDVADIASGTTPFGSVVEWLGARPVDTVGTAVGYPTPAFDWNTFSFYGIYVAYKDTTGSMTSDVLWMRNNDASAAYSFSFAQSDGDIVGTPWWDTVNETTALVDANGDGDQADTDVRIVYVGLSTGRIVKLVDNGTSLARPANGPWKSDFTSASVTSITSPLANDGTNLYFGGTDGASATKIFAVQVAGGANEATLQRTVGSVGVVTTTPSWATYSGSTYFFFGSTAVSSQAYVYRVNMTTGLVQSSFAGSTTNINDSIGLVYNRAYAVSDGGKLYVLDASNFAVGGFSNVAGFNSGAPYSTAAAKPIEGAPWVDSTAGVAYFGDDAGILYAVTGTGATLSSGFPLTISSSIKLGSPIYLRNTGVVAVGGDDGYVYFVNRNTGSGGAAIFKRFFITAAGKIASVSYSAATSQYMVSTSDGKLALINGSDVADPDSTH
jgi:hypothetical protein